MEPMAEQRLDGQVRTGQRGRVIAAHFAGQAEAASYIAAGAGWGPTARFFKSRLYLVGQVLQACAGGDLLDVGCGPGSLVAGLLKTRPGDFRITASDRSPAMVEAAGRVVGDSGEVRLTVANIEDMPFEDDEFDVVLALGVLEYVDVRRSLRDIARVVRKDGLVVVTMLNPLSPYRIFQWFVYGPAVQTLGRVERLLGVPPERRHAAKSGVRAMPARRLRRLLSNAGLQPQDVVYFDVTPLLPPFDRVIRRWTKRWRSHPEVTVGTGVRGWLGTGYLVTARRM